MDGQSVSPASNWWPYCLTEPHDASLHLLHERKVGNSTPTRCITWPRCLASFCCWSPFSTDQMPRVKLRPGRQPTWQPPP